MQASFAASTAPSRIHVELPEGPVFDVDVDLPPIDVSADSPEALASGIAEHMAAAVAEAVRPLVPAWRPARKEIVRDDDGRIVAVTERPAFNPEQAVSQIVDAAVPPMLIPYLDAIHEAIGDAT